MTFTARRQQFRAILAGPHCVYPASVFDPASARLAQDAGFELGMLAGSTASLTVLGAPDRVVLTLTELAAQCARICRAATLPLLVDADHGYGNALNVMRTVAELESAGVAALTIEDTLLPARFGEPDRPHLISLEEGVGKMRAALEARQDPALVIVARTSALTISGLEGAVERIRAYARTGVDAVFLVGMRSTQELDAIASALDVPIMLGNVATDMSDRAFLATKGVRVCLQGHLPIMAALRAVNDTLLALRAGTAPKDIAGIASQELLKQVTRDSTYAQWAEVYLGQT